MEIPRLGCMDAAKRLLHPRPTWRLARDASSFFFHFMTLSDSRRLGPYWAKSPIQAKIKKKKKKKRCKTQHLNSITNPKIFHAFFTSNFSSLSLVFVLSTSLSLLSVSVVRHSATQSHKQSHSQLTYNLTNPLSISSSQLNSSLNSQA